MINFVVLKETLSFGFLSYRNEDTQFSAFTVINQPSCEPFPTDDQKTDDPNINQLGLFEGKTNINFSPNIIDDGLGGTEIIIINSSFGINVTAHDDKFVDYKSSDFAEGDRVFYFKVKNDYFESNACIATLIVGQNGCYKNCKTCNGITNDFDDQRCIECNRDYYPIENYPTYTYSDKNCCKDDCPVYSFFSNDRFKLCHQSCLTCNGPYDTDCLTCYNQEELNKYPDKKSDIESKRGTTNYYRYQNKCLEGPIDSYYINRTLGSFKKCYESCKNCDADKDQNIHNCVECETNYYFFESQGSKTCYSESTILSNGYHNYYLNTTYTPKVWKPCNRNCYSCSSGGADKCIRCNVDTYPECAYLEATNKECYKNMTGTNHFFNHERKCFGTCDPDCLLCDAEPQGDTKNCIKCPDGKQLHNKNCLSGCPSDYYEYGEKCVPDCPIYTHKKEDIKACINCQIDSTNKCIYLGTNPDLSQHINECVPCNLDIGHNIFKANDEIGILDDCYQDCSSCSQRGTTTRMNCDSCKDGKCVVRETGNCVERNFNVDYHYMKDDTTECSYEKCYPTCKTCSGPGDVIHHNCITCRDNFQFDPSTSGNCVELCQFYWFIDPETNQFTCTTEEKCPETLPYLTDINKGCVEECSAAYSNEARFFYRYKNSCVTKCPENSLEDNLLYACHSLDDVDDIFTHMSNYISQGTYAENLLLYSSDNKKYFHIFNTTKLGKETYEKAANNIGTSIIDLSNCIATLK